MNNLATDLSLNDATVALSRITGKPVTLIKRLTGLSNTSYLVSSNNNKYALRINADNQHLGVDRKTEKKVLDAIRQASFTPRIIISNEFFLVTAYIEPTLSKSISTKDIANLFTEIHDIKFSTGVALDLQHHLKNYYEQIQQPSQLLSLCYQSAMRIPLEKMQSCLCHHDLLPANVLKNNIRCFVIDWEYASLGNPIFDLAVYAESEQLDDQQCTILLQTYGREIDIETLKNHRLFYAMLALLWTQIKKPQGDISLGLQALAKRLA